MLKINDVNAYYGHIQALFNVSIKILEGEIVTIIGSNGAGKSTILKSIMGLINSINGSITFNDQNIINANTQSIVKKGIILVPEGRRIFPGLTVYENLEIGATCWRKNNESIDSDIEKVYELFPKLKERYKQLGWSLSGGEAQMLAVARGLMARPKLLLLDEPSLGLAPFLVEQVFESLITINKKGISILLVEQNANVALSIANRGYVLQNGHITLEGSSESLRSNDEVRKAYLGL